MSKNAFIFLFLLGFLFGCSSEKKQRNNSDSVTYIRDFLKTFAFENLDECYPAQQVWTQAALLKKVIDIEYKFSDVCKLRGKFSASYLQEIPVNFHLKRFDEFERVNAIVKLYINQHRSGVFYSFELKQGSLVSMKHTIYFSAKYKVDTNPLTNELKPGTEKGEIRIINPATKKIKQTIPFTFH